MNRKVLGLLIFISCVAPTLFAETIRCESDRGRRHECSFDGWGRVELRRQISRTDCVLGRTWGTEGAHTVWVSNGCRADFFINRNRDSERRDESRRSRTVICESDYNSRHRCDVNTQYGVHLTRQISRTACILNRTWGYDSRGIWVRDGCRAEFTLGR
ncbi:MAG TPA: DUF3011 domain-containing protein [Thermoanaerobaculia bacterium]|jgi:hypothetical protein|nr:DUF3011 domain-containing protein [Thermoanaerobaculia bacterium]